MPRWESDDESDGQASESQQPALSSHAPTTQPTPIIITATPQPRPSPQPTATNSNQQPPTATIRPDPTTTCAACRLVIAGTPVWQGDHGPLHFGCTDRSSPWQLGPDGSMQHQAQTQIEELTARLTQMEAVANQQRNLRLRAEERAAISEALSAGRALRLREAQERAVALDRAAREAAMRDAAEQQAPRPIVDQTLLNAVQVALRETAHTSLHNGCASACSAMGQAQVSRVQVVANDVLWNAYRNRKAELRQMHSALGLVPSVLLPGKLPAIQRALPSVTLETALNERFVFHGTKRKRFVSIARAGFDDRVSSERNLYGVGVYFAEESCKSLQYCDEEGERCLVLCRVALGDPYLATGPLRGLRRPPLRDGQEHYVHDSVVAEVGTPNGLRGGTGMQMHREFVVFEKMQAYPELAIFFTIPTSAS